MKIPFKQGNLPKLLSNMTSKTKFREFQKLYKLPEHKKTSIHTMTSSGILGLSQVSLSRNKYL